jgi:cytochrome c peroxidase
MKARRSVLALCIGTTLVSAAPVPLGLPPETSVAVTEKEHAIEDLGRRLFADKRLSRDGSVACATCHEPQRQFTDGLPTAHGLGGQPLSRHTPSLLNVRYETSLFWDGRVNDLAIQMRTPLFGPLEHGFRSETALLDTVRKDAEYAAAFERLLGVQPAKLALQDLGAALSAYERTLLAGNSAFDRYVYGHDPKAMTAAETRGLDLFRGRAQCGSCHSIGQQSALLTDDEFHASPLPLPDSTVSQLEILANRVTRLRKSGDLDALNALIASDRDIASLGRYLVTLDPRDIGFFKTPSLRNVALTGPYMHDGSVATLEQAVDLEFYNRTLQHYPLVITEDERSDLLQFLKALSSQ